MRSLGLDWHGRLYGVNRDALRGTEWERWIRWAWEDDASPGPSCAVSQADLMLWPPSTITPELEAPGSPDAAPELANLPDPYLRSELV